MQGTGVSSSVRAWDRVVVLHEHQKSVTQKHWFLGSAFTGTLIQLSPIECGCGDLLHSSVSSPPTFL